MFVYSMRAGTIRFFAIICISLAALVALIAFVPQLQPVSAAPEEQQDVTTVNYEKIRTKEERIGFLAQFGWQVEEGSEQCERVTIPAEFDRVFGAYNEIQRAQGLDLGKYAARTVERYTYRITNYEGYEGEVFVNLLIHRGHVIGGDVCSADKNGFLHGFSRT